MTLSESPLHYSILFPESWYSFYPNDPSNNTPKPLGMFLGILAVVVGQLLCFCVFFVFKYGYLSFGKEPLSVQTKGARSYNFFEGLVAYVSQAEGLILLGGYLIGAWMFSLMPLAYYSFEGGIVWHKVILCLVVQDGIQYVIHVLEHVVSPTFYRYAHKRHHKFTNPRLFDASYGSFLGTVCMIVVPLYATANLVHCNVWSYMAFGSTYTASLTLIHSEYTFPWDGVFHSLGLGTPADHHVHHAFFEYNYGHLFMWFDMFGGTYKNPRDFAPKAFNKGV
jgi:alternative squalene epoxidase